MCSIEPWSVSPSRLACNWPTRGAAYGPTCAATVTDRCCSSPSGDRPVPAAKDEDVQSAALSCATTLFLRRRLGDNDEGEVPESCEGDGSAGGGTVSHPCGTG